VTIDKEESLEEALFNDVPEKEDVEKAATELTERRMAAAENFILFYFFFVLIRLQISIVRDFALERRL
jgi:hypothetical protein